MHLTMGHCEIFPDLGSCKEIVDKNRKNKLVGFNFERDTSVLILFFIGVPLLYYVLVELQKIKGKRLKDGNNKSRIPSLPTLPLIGPLYHIFQNRNDIGTMLETWARNYKTLAKTHFMGKPAVVINCPAMIQKLHSSTDPGHLAKSKEIYSKLFVGTSGKGLFLSPVDKWTPHRKLLNKAFNYESLKSYVPVFSKHASQLVSKLDTIPEIGDPTSNAGGEALATQLHLSCFEVISEIVLGIDIESALTREEHENFHICLSKAREIVSNRFHQPWLLSDLIWYFHPNRKELETTLQFMEASHLKIMEKRLNCSLPNNNSANENETKIQTKSVLDVMITANWSQEEILSEACTLLLGGHETVSLALTFIFFLLATEPEHQRACQEEVDRLFEDLDGSRGEISIESISQLKYLDRCIKETLRLFPTAPINVRALGAPLQLDNDIVLESGTLVMYNMWSLHRNPDYYKEPGRFDPDRFLPENCKSRPAGAYIPFSAGARNCIGWKMALLEMATMAAVVLRHFDVSTNDKLADVKVKFSFTVWPITQPQITLTRRQCN